VGRRGLEPIDVTHSGNKQLRNPATPGGAESAALAAENAPIDLQLAQMSDAADTIAAAGLPMPGLSNRIGPIKRCWFRGRSACRAACLTGRKPSVWSLTRRQSSGVPGCRQAAVSSGRCR